MSSLRSWPVQLHCGNQRPSNHLQTVCTFSGREKHWRQVFKSAHHPIMSPDVLKISSSLNKLSVRATYYWVVSEVWLCVGSNYWLCKHFRSWNSIFILCVAHSLGIQTKIRAPVVQELLKEILASHFLKEFTLLRSQTEQHDHHETFKQTWEMGRSIKRLG